MSASASCHAVNRRVASAPGVPGDWASSRKMFGCHQPSLRFEVVVRSGLAYEERGDRLHGYTKGEIASQLSVSLRTWKPTVPV